LPVAGRYIISANGMLLENNFQQLPTKKDDVTFYLLQRLTDLGREQESG
jgi:hypothetical protein